MQSNVIVQCLVNISSVVKIGTSGESFIFIHSFKNQPENEKTSYAHIQSFLLVSFPV